MEQSVFCIDLCKRKFCLSYIRWKSENPFYLNIWINMKIFLLKLCVSNKRQNGWTDRAQILCGTLHDHREGLIDDQNSKICIKQIKFGKSTKFFIKSSKFFLFYNANKEKKFTIEIADGREERTMNNLWTFTNCTFWTSFQTQRDWKNSCRGLVLFPFYSNQFSVTELHSCFFDLPIAMETCFVTNIVL